MNAIETIDDLIACDEPGLPQELLTMAADMRAKVIDLMAVGNVRELRQLIDQHRAIVGLARAVREQQPC